MGIFILIGILALVVGLLFIVAPEKLRKGNDFFNSFVSNLEEKAFTYRMGVGLSLIIASLLFFFVAYYINIKG